MIKSWVKKLFIWLDQRLPLSTTWNKYARNYYVPKNLNIYYCFGILALVVIINQFVSGLWLSMFFTPTVNAAFASIEYIMRDVSCGWLLRYMHSTGASALFIVIYVHIFRGLLYGSYQKPRELVWLLGCGLFFLLILEAFMGYLLPWGQMSYWGAQVMTSLLGELPLIGGLLMSLIRGSSVVGDATIHRFFALHVIGVPVFLFVIIYLHIIALHKVGSNNPDGIEIYNVVNEKNQPLDGVFFYPKYFFKDLVAVLVFLWLFLLIVFFFPDFNGYFLESSNFEPAKRLFTPMQIKPMWYMSPFYAMLRAIPHKLGGIFVLLSSFSMFIFLPWLDCSPVKSMRYKGKYSRFALASFVISFICLSYLGLQQVTVFKQILAIMCTVMYFAYFLLMPLYTKLDQHLVAPLRINTK